MVPARASAPFLPAAALLVAVVCRAQTPAHPISCDVAPGPVAVGTAQWNGWGRDTDNSRYQPEPALRAADVPRLAFKWAYGFAGAEDAGPPTVVDGRLFIGDSAGHVYALDARTGCSYWTYVASAAVRSAIGVAELGASKTLPGPKPTRRKHAHIDAHVDVQKAPSAVLFSDDAGVVYSLDAQRGTLLWKTPADPEQAMSVTGAPLLNGKALYLSLSAKDTGGAPVAGAVVALDIVTGKLLWKTPLRTRSGPGMDVARQLLYVATPEGIVALDLVDGRQRWTWPMPATADFRQAPILRRLVGAAQILIATGWNGVVYGYDPARAGEFVWQTRLEADRDDVRIDWAGAADHHTMYVGSSASDLTALDIATGKLRWHKSMPRPPAHALTVIPGALFCGALDGHLRAYSTIGGKIMWDVDTVRPYTAVNGVEAMGGAPGHGGVILVDGMVYFNSGNALLAFSLNGK
jgi:polyvinyl alcohol dehydrogenase (cytochrome)